MKEAKQDYRGLYEQIVKSEWFKKAYHNKSLGECPIVVDELEESEDERIYNEIMEFFKMNEKRCIVDNSYTRWIAWLEKQKTYKPTDEDERIRKELIEVVSDIAGGWPFEKHGITKKEAIAYLEKQKEQYWIPSDEQRFALGMVLKHSDPNAENTKILESLADDLTRIANPKVAKWKEQYKEKQKEQKPIDQPFEEWLDSWYKQHCSPTRGLISMNEKEFKNWSRGIRNMFEQKPVEPSGKLSRQDYLYQLLIDQLITYSDYEYLIEHKPAEWSEEDLDLSSVLQGFIPTIMGKYGMPEIERGAITETAYHFYKLGINERWKQNPEWSEEDEKMRCNILNVLTSTIVYTIGSHGTSAYKYNTEIEWLKSLRPSWKPSEEQMEALAMAVTFFKTKWTGAKVKEQLALESLYEGLTKLSNE